jgi:modulator of FtsH protease
MLIAFAASLVNIFFLKMPAFQMAISVAFAFISGGLIMYQTNAIIHGGERNYITATITLYVSIINIFLTILQLLGSFSGNRD